MLSTFAELVKHPPTSIIKSTDSMLIAGRGDELAVFVSIHPEFAALDAESERILREASELVVDSDESSRTAAGRMAQAKSEATRIEDVMRKPVTRRIDAAKKTVMDIFDSAKTARLGAAKIYADKITARVAELRRADETRRRQLEETQRKAREENERLARQSRERAEAQQRAAEAARQQAAQETDDKRRRELEAEARRQQKLADQNAERVAEREQMVETLSQDVVVEEREVDLGGAAHMRTKHKGRLLNFQKFVQMVVAGEIPNGYDLLLLNESAFNNRANDLKKAFEIPGVVEIYEDTTLARSKGV